jgi:plastocyanin
MRTTIRTSVMAFICAVAAWSCSGSTPASPSRMNPLASASTGNDVKVRAFDDPLTQPTPMPDPAAPIDPAIDPVAPTPMAVIIQIISSYGTGAFTPNPTTANVGDQLVFTNTDLVLHHIVLDDGTDLGDVAPGQSSAPVPLTTPMASFHCTIHPSMVGTINTELPVATPDPYYPPMDDYYGYY